MSNTGKMYKRTKKVVGVGINDADYITQKREVQPDGSKKIIWICPFYQRWYGLLKRCYGEKELIKHPTYKDCSVCEEWLYFSKFRAWMVDQDWEGKDLDKDLLFEGNKIYSPETCIFLETQVNRFAILRGNDRGFYPLGVSKTKYGYASKCSAGTQQNKSVYFKTIAEAHSYWQRKKLERAKLLQSRQTCERTKLGLQRVVDKLTNHIEQGVETKSL